LEQLELEHVLRPVQEVQSVYRILKGFSSDHVCRARSRNKIRSRNWSIGAGIFYMEQELEQEPELLSEPELELEQ
jgi:hypothetical protein